MFSNRLKTQLQNVPTNLRKLFSWIIGCSIMLIKRTITYVLGCCKFIFFLPWRCLEWIMHVLYQRLKNAIQLMPLQYVMSLYYKCNAVFCTSLPRSSITFAQKSCHFVINLPFRCFRWSYSLGSHSYERLAACSKGLLSPLMNKLLLVPAKSQEVCKAISIPVILIFILERVDTVILQYIQHCICKINEKKEQQAPEEDPEESLQEPSKTIVGETKHEGKSAATQTDIEPLSALAEKHAATPAETHAETHAEKHAETQTDVTPLTSAITQTDSGSLGTSATTQTYVQTNEAESVEQLREEKHSSSTDKEQDISGVPVGAVKQSTVTVMWPKEAEKDERIKLIMAEFISIVKTQYPMISFQTCSGDMCKDAPGQKVILPCIAASRIGSDIEAALGKSRIPSYTRVLLLIFHHVASHNKKTLTRNRVFTNNKLIERFTAMIDVFYWQGKIYQCDENPKSLQEFGDYMKCVEQ